MRYTLFLLLLVCHTCFALPLSNEAKKEADLFNGFLEVVYNQRSGQKNAFAGLQKLLEKAPDSVYLKRLLVAQAVAGKDPQAAAPYIDFIQTENPSVEDYSVYASYQAATDDFEGAISSYEKALALEPDNDALLVQYVTVLAMLNPDKAAEKLEELAGKYPSQASDLYTEIGRLYFYRQQVDKAFTYFNKALELDPQNPNARLGRGGVYEKKSQYLLMLHEFEELENMGFGSPSTYSRMASVYLLFQDLPKAEEYFLKTKKLNNADPSAAYFLAVLAEHRGDFSSALRFLRDSEDYAASPNKQLQASFYLAKLNQTEESLNTLQEAYQVSNGNVEVGYFYALALNDNHRYKQAARVLKDILQTNPDYQDARLQYAYALEGLKKYREMELQIQHLLAQNPQHAPALNLLAYSLAERNTRIFEAAAYSTRALAVSPEDISFIDTYAWILFKQGNLSEAARLFDSFPKQTFQTVPEIAYHAACVYAAQGRREEALSLLRLAADGGWKPAQKMLKNLR